MNNNKIESAGHSMASEVTNMRGQVVGGDMRVFVGPSQKGTFSPGGADDMNDGIGGVPYGLGKRVCRLRPD